MERKFNILMPLFGALGGIAGHFAGAYALTLAWPRPVMAGCYMGAVGLLAVLGCVLAECVSPVVNGYIWRQSYMAVTFKYLVPVTLLPVFLLGCFLQGVYQLDLSPEPKRDIYMLIDISGSMEWNDPGDERLTAVEHLAARFGRDERLEIIAFDHEAEVSLPVQEMANENARDMIALALNGMAPRGGTEFDAVLSLAVERIEENATENRVPVVILLSDGESEINPNTLEPYLEQGIAVNTVGMLLEIKDGEVMLESIARQTGGKFVMVSDTDQLDLAFSEVYQPDERFILNDEPGFDAWRFALYALAGGVLGFAAAFIFDNKPVTAAFTVFGVIGGALAGALLLTPLGLLPPAVALGFVFPFGAFFARKT